MRLHCSLLLLLLLNSVSWGAGMGSDIEDRAKLFSAKALAEAKSAVSAFSGQTNYAVLVETTDAPVIPEGASKDAKALDKFLDNWAADQHKQRKLRGVYIVITKNPTYGRIAVSADLIQETKAITPAEIEKWTKALEAQLAAKKYDAGLKEVLASVNAKLEKAPKPSGKAIKAERPKDSDAGGLKAWHFIVLGVVVVVIVRVGTGVLAVTKIKKPAPGTRAPSTGSVFVRGFLGEALAEKLQGKPQPVASYSPAPATQPSPAKPANTKPVSTTAAKNDGNPFG
jgi:hypothetical protein